MKSESSLAGKIGKITLATAVITYPLYSSGCAMLRDASNLGSAVNYGVGALLQPMTPFIEKPLEQTSSEVLEEELIPETQKINSTNKSY